MKRKRKYVKPASKNGKTYEKRAMVCPKAQFGGGACDISFPS